MTELCDHCVNQQYNCERCPYREPRDYVSSADYKRLIMSLKELDPMNPEFGLNYCDEMIEWSCKYCESLGLDGPEDYHENASQVIHADDCILKSFKTIYAELVPQITRQR